MNAHERFEPEPETKRELGRNAAAPPGWLTQLTRKLRRTQLMPLDCPTLRQNGFASESPATLEVITGKLMTPGLEVPFELRSGPEAGKLRLKLEGPLPGSSSPLALLVGPALHFFGGDSAAARLSFDAIAAVEQPDSRKLRAGFSESPKALAAHDGADSNRDQVAPRAHLPHARSNAVAWSYEANTDTFELAVHAPDDMPCASVAIEFASATDPHVRELHVRVVHGTRSSTGQLLKSIVELGPEALDREVDVVIQPIQADNPDHVQAFLAEAVDQFVTLPLREEPDGSFLVDFRWPDQKEAAANPLAGWALMIAMEQEVQP